MEIITKNFGFAGFLVTKYNAEIISNDSKNGIVLKINTNKFENELKEEYLKSDIAKFNNVIRKIIYNFKNN